MKTIGVGLVVALTLASAGAAHAEDLTHHRVFGDAGVGPADSAALAETAAVEKACSFNVMSRRGPDPEDVAACEAATARLMKRGVAAAPAIFASLDKEKVSYHAKQRLYDLLARTHDTQLVEPLIRGMARIASRKLDAREWETGMIHRALGEISRAPVNEPAPWVQATRRSPQAESISQTIDWRLWHEAHRGVSHDKLAADRLADARAHAADKDSARAFGAVSYLLEREPKEGLAAAQALLDRGAKLPNEGRQALDYMMGRATYEMKAAAEAAKAAAEPAAAPAQALTPRVKSSPAKSKAPAKAPKKQGKVGS
jgi:hypothetical protein